MEGDHPTAGEASHGVSSKSLLRSPLPRLDAHLVPRQLALPLLARRLAFPTKPRVLYVPNESSGYPDFLQPARDAQAVESVLARSESEGLDGADEKPAVEG
jgi:hypothetical protein